MRRTPLRLCLWFLTSLLSVCLRVAARYVVSPSCRHRQCLKLRCTEAQSCGPHLIHLITRRQRNTCEGSVSSKLIMLKSFIFPSIRCWRHPVPTLFHVIVYFSDYFVLLLCIASFPFANKYLFCAPNLISTILRKSYNFWLACFSYTMVTVTSNIPKISLCLLVFVCCDNELIFSFSSGLWVGQKELFKESAVGEEDC